MTAPTSVEVCPACGQPTQLGRRTRRMHNPCYARHRRRGTHLDQPRVYRRTADIVDDYLTVRASTGLNRHQIAARLGIKPYTLIKALNRAARAGDTRIEYRPLTWRPPATGARV